TYAVQGDTFAADKPRVWSTTRLGDIGLSLNFDVTADAKRLVALMPSGPPQGRRHLTGVEEFFDELRRRVRCLALTRTGTPSTPNNFQDRSAGFSRPRTCRCSCSNAPA